LEELKLQNAQLQHEKEALLRSLKELRNSAQKQQEEYELLLEDARNSLAVQSGPLYSLEDVVTPEENTGKRIPETPNSCM
jgi:hypothetical protein